MSSRVGSRLSSGKKGGNVQWVAVDNDLYLPSRFVSQFDEIRRDIDHQQVISHLMNHQILNCGFYYGRQLYAKIKIIGEQEIAKMHQTSRADAIYVNPSTMKTCNMTLAGPITIQCQGQLIFIGIVWPGESIPIDCIAISQQTLDSWKLLSQTFVTVKTASLERIYASEVYIKPLFEHDDVFISKNSLMYNYTLQFLDGKYPLPGNLIQVPLHGKYYEFEVVYLTGVNGHIDMEEALSPTDQLQEKIYEMNIEESNNTSGNLSSHKANDHSVAIRLTTECDTRSYNPSDDFVYHVSFSRTQIYFTDKTNTISKHESRVSFEQIGGLNKQITLIKELINYPSNAIIANIGIPNGILLYGPSGTGKTLLAEATGTESKAAIFRVKGPEIFSRLYGESEAKLRRIFEDAIQKAPSIILIDELDSLCPKRSSAQSEVEKRIVATLSNSLDAVSKTHGLARVVIIATTNRIDAIDAALRRPGRFDREIEIGIPSIADRADILRKILTQVHHALSDQCLISIAESTHGYVGADLLALCKEAAIQAVKTRTSNAEINSKDDEVIYLQPSDFQAAMKRIKPSAMREVAIEVPKVYWSDIGGQNQIKQRLKEAIEWPIKHPDAFKNLGITPPKGILLYGPPGCSKTLIAKALATESGINFLAVKGPELFNKWVGESERAVKELFRKARAASPSIVFFDEIDALAAQRGSDGAGVGDRVLTQLLTELDGIEQLEDVTVVAATNRPEMIDKALLRPGRVDRILYVPLPDSDTRREIFQIEFRKIPIHEDVDIGYLVAKTDGFSGAEVDLLCREAALAALQEDILSQKVFQKHFKAALKMITPRTSQDALQSYVKYQQQSGLPLI